MEILFTEIMDKIAHIVLDDDYEEYHASYTIRMQFLYSLMLEEVHETSTPDALELLIDEITSFESSQQYVTLTSLETFQNIYPETALSIFSSTAFGLAVEHLKGKPHVSISRFLKESFEALIADNTIMSKELLASSRMLISETILDFNFANGNSEIMSLRLKKLWDSMK